MRHHRRKKNRLVRWLPVLVAGALVVAAFIFAPSLQLPPPRTAGTRGALIPDLMGRPAAGASQEERPGAGGLDGAAGGARGPVPDASDAQHEVARGAAASPEHRDQTASEASARAKRRRAHAPAPAAPPPQDSASSDLTVRWNQ